MKIVGIKQVNELSGQLDAADGSISGAAIITRLEDLLSFVQLKPQAFAINQQQLITNSNFPLRVPLAYAKRIRKGDPHDPLLRQIIPLKDEHLSRFDFTVDPVADLKYQAAPGLIHKYADRALFITTGACAIHCRYCFRREYPYEQAAISDQDLELVIDYLHRHPAITEIILSGGDPLTLSHRRLTNLLEKLAVIPHLKNLRIHSRQPIVMPDRIDPALITLLSQLRFKTCVVIHCNHANEIDHNVIERLALLKQAGILLLNQSVLLKGVNDHAETLYDLSHRLYQAGVLPYYLNVLDRVRGSVHFLVEDEQAKRLINELRASLPGYLVPRLVKDIPGKAAKTILA